MREVKKRKVVVENQGLGWISQTSMALLGDPGTVQVSGNRAIEQQQWTKLLCDSEGGRRKQDHVIITSEHRLGIRA